MPILTFDEFVARRSGDRSPMLDFYWYCIELPFDGDPDYVETVSLPFPSINMKPLFMAGRFEQYPGFMELSAFDITFYEDVRMRSHHWVKEWQDRIVDPDTGAYSLPGAYKRNMRFALTDGTTTDTPILTVTLEGTWPTTTSPIDLTNAGGQALKVQQNFALDRVRFS